MKETWKGGEVIFLLCFSSWRSYFSSLLNKTNKYQLDEEDKVEGSIWGATEQVVEQALKSMKVPVPSGVTSNLKKATGATVVKGRFQVCKSIEEEGEAPEQWAKVLLYRYIKVKKMS